MKWHLRLVAALALCALALGASAQSRKDGVVIGMTLEPPGLDPTTAPAAPIGEIVHYNILDLTIISRVEPLDIAIFANDMGAVRWQ